MCCSIVGTVIKEGVLAFRGDPFVIYGIVSALPSDEVEPSPEWDKDDWHKRFILKTSKTPADSLSAMLNRRVLMNVQGALEPRRDGSTAD